MKFQKSKCEVLGPGLNNCTSGQARDKLTERFVEKSWRLMVGKKLTMSWHCAFHKSGLVTPGLWQQECSQQTGRTDPSQLFSLGETTSGVLCASQDHTGIQEEVY